jgi:hypothetical protein
VKNLLITITATLVCVAAFGQGKLEFMNNTDNLIYFTTGTLDSRGFGFVMMPADVGKTVGGFPLAGSSAYTGAGSTIAALAGSPTLVAGLWAGTSPGSLSFVTSATIGDVNLAGQINGVQANLAGLPAGTPAFFQVQVYDSRATSALDAWEYMEYAGESPVFQATPQQAVYSPIYQTASPVNSTWAAGTFSPVDFVGYPGYYGGIAVGIPIIPEPGTFALVGLGAAVLMIFRRRR